MQLNTIRLITRARIAVLLASLSMLLVACDLLVSPEPEEPTFEGSPEVIISSPLNGDTYQDGVGVNILLRVDNAGPDVARVAIQVDGQIIGEAILPNLGGDPSFTVSNGWPATGAGSHIISAVASRSDGTVSNEASVTINVVASAVTEPETNTDTSTTDTTTEDTSNTQDTLPTPVPTRVLPSPVPTQDKPELTPTDTVPPTDAPTSTPAPTNTPSRPQANITTGANVRSGPGIVFDPPIGSLPAGAQANLLAISSSGTWYKIQYYNGDGWISAQVASTTGDLATLPRELGPATPVQATATLVATATPASAPDLSVTGVVVNPHPFVCNQSSEIQITIANSGNANAPGGTFKIEDIHNGTVGANTTGVFPELAPGASHTASVFLTVSNNFAEAHHTRITVDQNGQIAESNEGNNVRNEAEYVLGTGGC